MGLYDTVYVGCPKCGRVLDFQSKAGERKMCRYNGKTVPANIATDVDKQVKTCDCGSRVKIVLENPVPRQRMIAVIEGEEE
jgi:hypothetical protein